ncbi:B12-binding domain-containing radical SAM protein, partial [Chloroflexota bacterium]
PLGFIGMAELIDIQLDEDVEAIAKLCNRILTEGRRIVGGRAKLNVSVGTFVPKPHTPFQWVACDTPEMIETKQDILRNKLRDRNIKLTWTSIEDTLLEAWLTRGDRRLSEVIYSAWENGAKFDAWQEQHRYALWMDAFSTNGLSPDFYTHRERKEDEIFPWENISAGVRKAYLFKEYKNSLDGIIQDDCREECYACGILPTFADLRRENPGDVWGCPEVKSPKRKKVDISA